MERWRVAAKYCTGTTGKKRRSIRGRVPRLRGTWRFQIRIVYTAIAARQASHEVAVTVLASTRSAATTVRAVTIAHVPTVISAYVECLLNPHRPGMGENPSVRYCR